MRLVLLLPLLLAACAAPREQVVLLDAAGTLAVQTKAQAVTLTTPYQTAAVTTTGQVQAGQTDATAVQARWGAVLATLPETGRRYTLYFAPGSTRLTPESQAILQQALTDIASHAASEVEITGHTDTMGELEANDALSLARAEAVRVLLGEAGMRQAFVRVVGRGERALLVETVDETAEPRNRRVEVLVR